MHSTIRGQKATALGKFILRNGSHESCVETSFQICSKVAHILEDRKSKAKNPTVAIGKESVEKLEV